MCDLPEYPEFVFTTNTGREIRVGGIQNATLAKEIAEEWLADESRKAAEEKATR